MNNNLYEGLINQGVEVDECLERLMGDEVMYLKYLYELPDNLNIIRLREDIETNNYNNALKQAHTLKGIALNLGLLSLVDRCNDLMNDLKDNKTEFINDHLKAIEDNFKQIIDVINRR